MDDRWAGLARELVDDFEDAPEIAKSGLYKLMISANYGGWTGKPYGFIVLYVLMLSGVLSRLILPLQRALVNWLL